MKNILKEYIDKIILEQMGNIIPGIIKDIENSEAPNLEALNRELLKRKDIRIIGSGAFRNTFEILGEDLVIKVAKTDEGRRYNQSESNPKLQSIFQELIPKVYDASSDGSWMLVEKIPNIINSYRTMEWFFSTDAEIFDFMDTKQAYSFINSVGRALDNSESPEKIVDYMEDQVNFNFDKNEILEFFNSRFGSRLVELSKNVGTGFLRDIRPGNIGIASDGRPVIVDYALEW
jgi:hypothetical protein